MGYPMLPNDESLQTEIDVQKFCRLISKHLTKADFVALELEDDQGKPLLLIGTSGTSAEVFRDVLAQLRTLGATTMDVKIDRTARRTPPYAA